MTKGKTATHKRQVKVAQKPVGKRTASRTVVKGPFDQYIRKWIRDVHGIRIHSDAVEILENNIAHVLNAFGEDAKDTVAKGKLKTLTQNVGRHCIQALLIDHVELANRAAVRYENASNAYEASKQ